MNTGIKFLLLLPAFFLLLSCKEDPCPPISTTTDTIEVLPLGDSRVEGFRSEFESYRYELWKNLIQNGWEVDFIGSRVDEGAYPNVNDLCFDKDHEGTGGATTLSILETLESLTLAKEPEVVLLGIGGNDLTETSQSVSEVLENIGQIVMNLQARNDSVIIFLEQIAPGTTEFMTADLTATFLSFNQQIPALTTSLSTEASKVIVVDMAQDWSDSYMADVVHYNEAGAKVVADRYYQAMEMHVER